MDSIKNRKSTKTKKKKKTHHYEPHKDLKLGTAGKMMRIVPKKKKNPESIQKPYPKSKRKKKINK